MKEASGEANMTVITIVLIGVVLAAGTMIVNNMMNSTKKSSCCQANGGVWHSGKCYQNCNGNSCTGSVAATGCDK